MTYERDKAWSDNYLPHIKQILGPRLLKAAPLQVDRHQATDLMLLRAEPVHIAARVRQPGYLERYRFEVTMRAGRPSGVPTEWDKVMVGGWGDWMFYGHAAPTHYKVSHWVLLDLDALRQTWRAAQLPLQRKTNTDGTSFVALDVRHLPKACVLDSNHISRTQLLAG